MQAKLDRTGDCWLWTGYIQDDGYATLKNYGKPEKIHRVAYTLAYGPIPEGKLVDHRCRVRHCARPSHLRLATNKQNMENLTPRDGRVRGVYWHKARRKWMGRVTHYGKVHYVGSFDSINAAEYAVTVKRKELFTFDIGEQ